MYKQNLDKAIEILHNAETGSKLTSIFTSRKEIIKGVEFGYKTFTRAVQLLAKEGIIEIKKVSNGRGKGINHLLTKIDKKKLRKKLNE